MKRFIEENIKVVIIAAAVLFLSAGVLFTTVSLAQGAETGKTVIEESTYAETISAENPQKISKTVIVPASAKPLASQGTIFATAQPSPVQSKNVEYAEPSSSRSPATISAGPSLSPHNAAYLKPSPQGAEYITENDARNIFIKKASDLFGIQVKNVKLTFETQDDGNSCWQVTNKYYSCYIDAISGAVIQFNLFTKYEGKKITAGEFDNPALSDAIYNDPDNIYIRAAKDLVNTKLAQGRTIDNIELDGIQFVWDNDNSSSDPNEKGTIMVDCHVYMHTGLCYTLSYCGTENPELFRFSTQQTQDGCRWGYFYEEDASNYPPEPSGGWDTAPGLVTAPNASAMPQPTVTP